MEIEHPYSTTTFNTLPGLRNAHDNFLARDGPKVINVLGQLFVKYKLANDFGVALLHRHFALEANQRLVDVNGTSTPWTVPQNGDKQSDTTFQKYGGQIRAHLWMIAPGTSSQGDDLRLTPSEFFFESAGHEYPNTSSLEKLDPTFVQKFAAVLAAHGLLGTLGLYLIRPGSHAIRAEVTEGRANVTFPLDPEKGTEGLKLIEAQWQYAQDGNPNVLARCTQVCVQSIFVPTGHERACV